MDNPGWKCPDCGKEYDAPPKWCPCEPYPMPEPYLAFYVVEMDAGKKTDWGNEESLGQMPALSGFQENPEPFTKVTMVDKLVGIDILGDGYDCGTDRPDTPFEIAEGFMERRRDQARDLPDGTETGYMLIEESYRPGIETLDTLTWRVVDITKEEYSQFLDKVH